MIFVDTGAWYSFSVENDAHHSDAVAWMRRNQADLITTDYVIDETLTLLKSRRHAQVAQVVGYQLFSGLHCRVYYLTEADVQATWDTFRRFSDKEWSFTDCSSKVVMEKLGLTQAFAFDQHFRQFGMVEVVP